MEYLDLTPEDLEKNENIAGYTDKKLLRKLKEEEYQKTLIDDTLKTEQIITGLDENKIDITKLKKEDLAIDFTTSSAISRVNVIEKLKSEKIFPKITLNDKKQ